MMAYIGLPTDPGRVPWEGKTIRHFLDFTGGNDTE